jgi:hypothetical protein
MKSDRLPLALVAFVFALHVPAQEPKDKEKELQAKTKEIAGVAEFLRSVPKHFATLQAVDAAKRRVTLLVEGDKFAKAWDLTPDAEIKCMGWWGRLDQFTAGDRVWCWFAANRQKEPVAIMMLADEPSEQDIHGTAWKVASGTADTVFLQPGKGTVRPLKTSTLLPPVPPDERVYFQSAGDKLRFLLDAKTFEKKREEQKAALRKRWEAEGLPGSVMFLHQYSGEMEFILDHEAMRWGRSLKPGDSVTLTAAPPIKGVVRDVKPWRERTQLRLVVAAADQGDLHPGQRLNLKMTPPPLAVDQAQLPPDLGRRKNKEERIEWFLASIYCTCGVSGNICTGHFYTLASCNPNGCGHPAAVKERLGEWIDKELSDEQIFAEMLKAYGSNLLKPHLLP